MTRRKHFFGSSKEIRFSNKERMKEEKQPKKRTFSFFCGKKNKRKTCKEEERLVVGFDSK